MRRRGGLVLVVAAGLGLVGGATSVSADHRERPRQGMREVGFHPLLNAGFNTDVWSHSTADGRLFAYVGTWGTAADAGDDPCPAEGVKIVDASDPGRPKLVGAVASPTGSQVDDVTVAAVRTARFSGDLLAHSMAPCGVEALVRGTVGELPPELVTPTTGVRLYDVSEPIRPVLLGEFNSGGLGSHALALFGRPDLGRTFVAAVHNDVEGSAGGQLVAGLSAIRGQLQILDVTNPAAIQLVSSYDPQDEFLVCDARGSVGGCFVDGVSVSADGRTAYLAGWDGGVVVVDIADPAAPRLIGGALSQVYGDQRGWLDEEGNTHATAPLESGGRRLLVTGDADYDGGGRYAEIVPVAGSAGGPMVAVEWEGTPPLRDGGVTGDLFYAGGGCVPSDYDGAPAGFIALVEEFDCLEDLLTVYAHKLAVAQAAGAAALVMITPAQLPPPALATNGGIPAVSVGFPHGSRLRQGADPGTAAGVRARVHGRGAVNPWGFMRVLDVSSTDVENWREVGRFLAPHVQDLDPADGDVLSAHNPYVVGNRVFFSWWTNGVRVLEVDAAGRVTPRAWFVPTNDDHDDDLDADPHGVFSDSAGIWGVHVTDHPRSGEELVFASDVNRGLYVLSLDRPAASSGPVPAPPGTLPATGATGRSATVLAALLLVTVLAMGAVRRRPGRAGRPPPPTT